MIAQLIALPKRNQFLCCAISNFVQYVRHAWEQNTKDNLMRCAVNLVLWSRTRMHRPTNTTNRVLFKYVATKQSLDVCYYSFAWFRCFCRFLLFCRIVCHELSNPIICYLTRSSCFTFGPLCCCCCFLVCFSFLPLLRSIPFLHPKQISIVFAPIWHSECKQVQWTWANKQIVHISNNCYLWSGTRCISSKSVATERTHINILLGKAVASEIVFWGII